MYQWKTHGKEISKIQKKKKKKDLTHTIYFLPHPKISPGPKMSKSGYLLSMVVSYTLGKPMEDRFPKKQKILICLTHFLPHRKISPEPKMTQKILSLKMCQNGCSSSMTGPILLESPWKADLKYGFWSHFVPKNGSGSQN